LQSLIDMPVTRRSSSPEVIFANKITHPSSPDLGWSLDLCMAAVVCRLSTCSQVSRLSCCRREAANHCTASV
jgi:hypothetical protein